MVAPGITQTMASFHTTSKILGTLMVTIYILGFAVGPLFLGPLSEVYGRYPVVILSTWFLNVWILGGALAPTMGSLIAMRLLAGIGGSAVMTIAPAIVADIFPVEKRAFGTSIITLAQCLGPASKSDSRLEVRSHLSHNSWSSLWWFHNPRPRMEMGLLDTPDILRLHNDIDDVLDARILRPCSPATQNHQITQRDWSYRYDIVLR
jgi:hypothetical protein